MVIFSDWKDIAHNKAENDKGAQIDLFAAITIAEGTTPIILGCRLLNVLQLYPSITSLRKTAFGLPFFYIVIMLGY